MEERLQNTERGLKRFLSSDGFKKGLWIILGVLLLLFVFQLGMFFGFRKALFSDREGGAYFRELRGGDNDMLTGFRTGDYPSGYGAVGKIVGVTLPTIVIEDRDGNDKSVLIGSTTEIEAASGSEKASDLKLDDTVVVFGAPSDGNPVIEARLIRLLPPPPPGAPASSSRPDSVPAN